VRLDVRRLGRHENGHGQDGQRSQETTSHGTYLRNQGTFAPSTLVRLLRIGSSAQYTTYHPGCPPERSTAWPSATLQTILIPVPTGPLPAGSRLAPAPPGEPSRVSGGVEARQTRPLTRLGSPLDTLTAWVEACSGPPGASQACACTLPAALASAS